MRWRSRSNTCVCVLGGHIPGHVDGKLLQMNSSFTNLLEEIGNRCFLKIGSIIMQAVNTPWLIHLLTD